MLGSDWHIVLADDDSLQRNLLARSLRECSPGVKVTTAGSGAELFDLLEKGTYDCIVLDCHMPPLGVYELLSAPQIRRAECPVIAMSNSKDQGVVIASLRGGAVDFVPKCDAMHGSYLWNCVCRAVSRSRWRAVERRHMVRRQQYLESIAHTDPLTGLLNRRSFERRLAKRVARRDCKAETLACAMLDIDHFKATNDRFGHAAGDAVLAAVGRSIQSLLGPNDAAFRWGGEEFLILRASPGVAESYVWADELRRHLSSMQIRVGGRGQPEAEIRVTASIGVDFLGGVGLSPDVIERADQAMYLAKNGGRNRVCTWPMVSIDQALSRAARLPAASVLDRRRYFIAECESYLGEAQKLQVTEHCERVAAIAADMGRFVSDAPNDAFVDHLWTAGLLHDIGKCILPGDLLEKAGALTESERAVVCQTPAEGARMSLRLGASDRAVDAIDHQRDWYCQTTAAGDGKSACSSIASLLRVADAFASMTAERPYGPRRSAEEAKRELDKGRGREFDPAAIDLLNEKLRTRAAA